MKKINTINTLKELENYRKELNEACDKRALFITRCDEADKLSHKPFNYIKESFEALSPMLFKTKEGKSILGKYINAIKESESLSTMHTICENIRKANKNSDVDFFISTIANEKWSVNENKLQKDTLKLGRILAEAYLLVGDKNLLPKENESLSSAINFIAETKKTSKNIAEYSDAMKIIRESIMNNESQSNIFESKDIDKVAQNLLNEFNEKYNGLLSEDEMKAIKEVFNSSNKEDVFEKYKNDCTKKLSEAKLSCEKSGDNETSKRLSTIIEQVSKKKYTSETMGSDICNLIELGNIFD